MGQDVVRMGRHAVELLLERIERRQAARRQVRITPTYRHRASCGCPEVAHALASLRAAE